MLRRFALGVSLAVGMLESVRNKIPLEFAERPVVVLPARVARLQKIIEKLTERIFGDRERRWRFDPFALRVEIPHVLYLSGIAAAVIVDVDAGYAGNLQLLRGHE